MTFPLVKLPIIVCISVCFIYDILHTERTCSLHDVSRACIIAFSTCVYSFVIERQLRLVKRYMYVQCIDLCCVVSAAVVHGAAYVQCVLSDILGYWGYCMQA